LAAIIAPDMDACAAPARNSTALSSIHTTMDGGFNLRTSRVSPFLTL
jgi:hypothetical protein